MAQQQTLAIRLSVVDGGKVKAELMDVGETGAKALKKIEKNTKPANDNLQQLNNVTKLFKGNLNQAAAQTGTFGSNLAKLGPVGLAAAAGIGILTATVLSSTKALEEQAKTIRKMEAVMKATGQSSGMTSRQIQEFASNMSKTTLASGNAVMEAATRLSTFTSVSKENFTKTIELAQDMAAVFGGDLTSNVTTLGRALESPADGLRSLRKVGIFFTASQQELIRTMSETGDVAGAQAIILAQLEKQVGGAGTAENKGITAATNSLASAWDDMLKAIGKTKVVSTVAEGSVNILKHAMNGLTMLLEDDPLEKQIADTKKIIERYKKDLAKEEEKSKKWWGNDHYVKMYESRIEKYEDKLAKLQQELQSHNKMLADEQRIADEGLARAKAEKNTETAADRVRALGTNLDKFMDTPYEKIQLVNRELAQTRKELDSLRNPDGSNDGIIDDGLRKAEALAQEQRDAVLKAKPEGASRLFKGSNSNEQYKTDLAEIDRLMQAGMITSEQYGNALAEAQRLQLEASKDWQDGVKLGFKSVIEESNDMAKSMQSATSKAFNKMEDSLMDFVMTGKFSFSDMANSMINDLMRVLMRQAIIAPIANSMMGMFGAAHSGGVIGADSLQTRSVDMRVFAGAPKFHKGGLIGDEVPIIAKRGEVVFTKEQLKALGDGNNLNVSVNVVNKADNTNATADYRREGSNLSLDVIIEQIEGAMSRNVAKGGGMAGILESRYGLNPAAGALR